MEAIYSYLLAILGAVFSVTGLVGVLCLALGWIICYYTARRHPTEAAAINAFATKHGTEAKDAIVNALKDLRGK